MKFSGLVLVFFATFGCLEVKASAPLMFSEASATLKTDTAALLQKSILAVRNLKRLAGWAAEQEGIGRVKGLADSMSLSYIKLDELLVKIAAAHKIEIPKSKTEGAFNPDGRVEATPENLRDTIRMQNTERTTTTQEVGRKAMANSDEFEQTMLMLMKTQGAAAQSGFKRVALAETERLMTNLTMWLNLVPNAAVNDQLTSVAKYKAQLQQL